MSDDGGRELRDAVVEALGVEAVPVDVLRDRLGPPWNEPRDGRDELDRLLQMDTAFSQVLGGSVFLPAALEGTTWAAWIDPEDGAQGFVRMFPALTALGWWLVGADVELLDAAGASLGALETDGWMLDDRDTDVLLGPDGWLDDVQGRWATFEVVGGAVRLSPMDGPPAPTAAQGAAVTIGFDRALQHMAEIDHRLGDATPPDARYTSGEGTIIEALLIDRSAFLDGPVPPLSDLWSAAGLSERDGMIAGPAFDWDALDEWRRRRELVRSYGLDTARADEVATLVAAFAEWHAADGEAPPPAASADALDDGDVAETVWIELRRRGATDQQLVRFTSALASTDPSSIGAVWVRARALDRSGDAVGAMGALEALVDSGCRHRPVLVDLAGFRADRGDAVGALRLLTQAGIGPAEGHDHHDHDLHDHDHHHDRSDPELLWDEVEPYATVRPRPTARRNDPCPCGSGRKYKTCHLGRETHSLEDRAGWLYIKADRFLRDRFPELVDDLAGVIADPLDQPELFDLMVDSTLVPDLVLHEDGVFAEFLAARAGILPPDEAQLGEQWAATDHAVFEVIEIHAHDVELREVTGGDHISVRHIEFGGQIRPTTLVVGRPLPIADHHRAFGGLMPCPPVHLNRLLTALASGSSDEIASVIADIVAPPVLTNTDGHDLVAHRITWAVEDPTVVGEALVAAGLQAAGADRWTLIRLSRELDDVTVATVTLDGDRLTGDVNSAERAEELQRLVTAALPGAGLLDVDARPFELPPGTPVDEIDDPMDEPGPELRAALAEITARFDER